MQYLYARTPSRSPASPTPRPAWALSVPPSGLQAGDAVFFADASGYIGHEGLYLGNGSFVHAPHTGDVVKISSLSSRATPRRYAGARRYA